MQKQNYGFLKNLEQVRIALSDISCQMHSQNQFQHQKRYNESIIIDQENNSLLCNSKQYKVNSTFNNENHFQQKNVSVSEQLQIKWMKQMIDQLCQDNQIVYNNFQDSLKVINMLQKKLKIQENAIQNSYNQIKVEYIKKVNKLEVEKNINKLFEKQIKYWKDRFLKLKDEVKNCLLEEEKQSEESNKIIHQLQQENSQIRQLLNLNISPESMEKIQAQIEKQEADFFNSHCQKNVPSSDIEIKYFALSAINKDFKKLPLKSNAEEMSSNPVLKQLQIIDNGMQDLSSEIHKNINIKLPEKNKQLSFQEDECHEEEEDEEETNYYNFQNSIKSKQDSIDFTDRSKAKQMLLQQSQQLSLQMSKPKFFKRKESEDEVVIIQKEIIDDEMDNSEEVEESESLSIVKQQPILKNKNTRYGS